MSRCPAQGARQVRQVLVNFLKLWRRRLRGQVLLATFLRRQRHKLGNHLYSQRHTARRGVRSCRISRRSTRNAGLHARARGAGARRLAAIALALELYARAAAVERYVTCAAFRQVHAAPSSGRGWLQRLSSQQGLHSLLANYRRSIWPLLTI